MVLFYVSGHGFGHATRSRAIMDALRQLRPDVPIHVRTRAPASIFPADVVLTSVEIDPAVVESANSLTVEGPASAGALLAWMESMPELIHAESEYVRQASIRLIVADIPFVAGPVAQACGIPAVAAGNFTWDWIFEPVLQAQPALATVRESYGMFSEALRFPLSQPDGWDIFPRVQDVPLVSPRSPRTKDEVRAELGLQGESRPVVLVGGRALLAPGTLERIARSCPDFSFLGNNALPSYHDLVCACDIVVSKIGYSIAAECIAERKELLFPPRRGFREEEILRDTVPQYIRALPIHPAAWLAGSWGLSLRTLIASPQPSLSMPANGAEVCAARLAQYL